MVALDDGAVGVCLAALDGVRLLRVDLEDPGVPVLLLQRAHAHVLKRDDALNKIQFRFGL